MKLLLVTFLLVHLLFSSASIVPRILNCDDVEAHEAATAAVNYINNHHIHGYKYTLNQIDRISVQHTHGHGENIFLELDLLETKCPSVSPTPVEKCLVRPVIEQAIEGDCDVKLNKNNGTFTVLSTRCKSELDSKEKTLRILAPLNNTQVQHAVEASLLKFNSGNNTVFYGLHEIGRGQIQGGISNTANVEFIVVASNCSKEEANSGMFACVEDTGVGGHYGACSGSVVKLPDAVDEDVTVQCTIYEPQPRKVAQVAVPVSPHKPNVGHPLHHHLVYHSSESTSSEVHAHGATKNHAVKRSLTGHPVLHNAPHTVPICPGKKIHF